jgi:glycosyltransferase involved in cell wall biosynthesis
LVRTAYVSTYPPRHCGIATFTNDLALATGSREIVALHPPDQREPYPAEVHHRIRRDEFGDYIRVARSVSQCVDVVSIQHEYGIWGGENGGNVLDFMRELRVPAIATLHTVLRQPSPEQRVILADLVAGVSVAVVLSQAAASLLIGTYGVDPQRIEVIPHGVPDLPIIDSLTVKPRLELDGRQMILSFGLMGPSKGYELMLDALPAVVAAHPSVCYVIVGATHPSLLLREGEAYRESLQARVTQLKLEQHVRFVDRFIGRVELTRWLEAADLFVTPCPNMDQIVSGTLAYAMGAGRAIVSTPYLYAAELLADDRGVLVPAGSPAALASAVIRVLADDALRSSLGRRAYAHSRNMIWSSVGSQYRDLLARVASGNRVQDRRTAEVVDVRV